MEPEYKRALFFCRKLEDNREKGDDLLQESLLLGLRKFNQLREEAAFKAWLYKIIMSTFKTIKRREKFKRFTNLSDDLSQTMAAPERTDSDIAKYELGKLLSILKPDDRAMVVLYELEEWNLRELSELYNKSEGSLKIKLHRIRKRMKDEMERLEKKTVLKSEGLSEELVEKYAV